MDQLLAVPSNKVRSKAGTTPLAQIETQCSTGGNLPGGTLISNTNMGRITKEHPQLGALINFMLASACRVSEALSVKPSDITSTGHVKIKGKKGSKIKIVHSGISMEYLLLCKKNLIAPWQGWTRFYVYHQFKKYSISAKLHGRERNTVTHLPRHTVAKAMKKENFQINDTQQMLGHKSQNSTAYYHE